MPLDDFLMPGEEVRFRLPRIRFGDQTYEFIITNKRVILYARRGLIFKKDDFIGIRIDDILNVAYREEGIISKKAKLLIDTKEQRFIIEGSPRDMKAAYQGIMQFWSQQR